MESRHFSDDLRKVSEEEMQVWLLPDFHSSFHAGQDYHFDGLCFQTIIAHDFSLLMVGAGTTGL